MIQQEKNLFTLLRNSSFWATIYPKTLHVLAIILFAVIVFFAQELILAKKKLFNNLSTPSSFSFLVCTFFKLLLLLLPIIAVVSIYMYSVVRSFFFFGIRISMNSGGNYTFPFKTTTTIFVFSILIFYLYYTMCLFIERFSFTPLLKFYVFFKHIVTVIELIIGHILVCALFAGLGAALFFVMKNLTIYKFCFSFLFIYICAIVMIKNARFPLLIPIVLAGCVITGSYFIVGAHFVRLFWSALFISTLVFNLVFIFGFMLLSAIAHLFVQTAFVFCFNKTPSSDIMDTSAEKLGKIEDLYDEYLDKHEKRKENFFDDL